MKDITILSCFGIRTDELENYELRDYDDTSCTLLIRKRKGPNPCPNCGIVNSHIKDYKTKKYFFRNINGLDVKVLYQQRRYVCPECGKTFMETNPFINNSNYVLSSIKIHNIVQRLKETLSIKQVADYCGVSSSSVYKVLDEYVAAPRRYLPKVLSIDEFLSFNSNLTSKYSCLLINFETGTIIDIIRSRQTPWLKDFFIRKPIEEREKVQYIIMDMYRPYKDIAMTYLPNAVIVIDPFHFIRYTVDAIEAVRIRIMKQFLETDIEYRLLKKYKNLLLMKYEPADYPSHRVRILEDKRFSDKEILNMMLSYDETLAKAYNIGHTFLSNLNRFGYKEFKDFMNTMISIYACSNIDEFISVSQTYSNWINEICNSKLFKTENRQLSNGPIEGRNNKIKVLKRISYGMTNFDHLRKRIFLIFEKKDPIK